MKKRNLKLTDNTYYWLMVLPAIVLIFLFNTRTWPGILAAFEKFMPTNGWFGSKWVGWQNFKIFFKQPDCLNIIRNTVVIAVGKIVFVNAAAIVFSLLLNEITQPRLKKLVQTCTYLPHFVSWVIYAAILKNIIGTGGLIPNMLNSIGANGESWLTRPEIFQPILISTETLKEFGWGAIMYLAAITAIDPGLYEAAEIDGASRWQLAFHVTLPGMRQIIVLNMVLGLGNVLNAGFDQVFNLYNTMVMSTGDIIDTWVYRQGILSMNYGMSTAVGLFKSAIAMVLTIIAYWAADKFADYKIF